MGKKKSKSHSASKEFQCQHVPKRKISVVEEPPVKRMKRSETQSYPGQFVLLRPPKEDSDAEHEPKQKIHSEKLAQNSKGKKEIIKKKKKTSENRKATTGNVNKQLQKLNGNSKKSLNHVSLLKSLYNGEELSDDEEWMSGESDTDSFTEEDESCSEEWSTDTDYTGDEYSITDSDDHSYHESDCEYVGSDEEESLADYCSDDDSDYVPNIEDKFIKPGEAIMYEAKGLNLAFGNSNVSQIIDITDICPAQEDLEEEEIPELVGETMEPPKKPEIRSFDSYTTPENLLNHLHLDDDEIPIASSCLNERAVFHSSPDDEAVTLQLQGKIHFHGVLIIKPLVNRVQVNGYTLDVDETLTIASISKADFFLELKPVIDNINHRKSEIKWEKYPNFNPAKEVLIELHQGIPGTALEMLTNYSLHPLLPNKKMLTSNSPCQTAELKLGAKFFVAEENQKIDAFVSNEDWSRIEIGANSRVVVIGGKNVGKSSLSQFIINQNVKKFKKILLIDLDIGQPICGAAQTVSATVISKPLLGPGYLSENSPEFSLFYGSKNVMTSPFKYVRCVQQLIKLCDHLEMPWIVNTMGYQKGFGLQLMCLLLRVLQPTDVIQIQHGVKSLNFQEILTENLVKNWKFSLFDAVDLASVPENVAFTTHVLDSIVNNRGDPKNWISNSTEKRKLSILAQLSKLLRGQIKSLNDVEPFRAPIAKLRMLVVDEEFSQTFSYDLLNGNLVYLCHAPDDSSLGSDSILQCFGVGIVRGVDKINGQIYLLLPESSTQQLQAKINVLAIGSIPLPAEILLKQSYNITEKVPHVTFFKDRNASSQKYVNKKGIKDCF